MFIADYFTGALAFRSPKPSQHPQTGYGPILEAYEQSYYRDYIGIMEKKMETTIL